MKLLAATVLLVTLGFGAGGHRSSRCHGIYGVATFCDAQAATPEQTQGARFAGRYMRRWNRIVGRSHGVWIDRVGCVPNDTHVYTCEERLRYAGQIHCKGVVIDDTWRTHALWNVVCQGPFKPRTPVA